MLFFLFTSNKSQFCAFFFFCFSNFCFTYIEQCSLRFGIGRSANLAPIERYSSPILHTHSHFRSDLFNLWLLYADLSNVLLSFALQPSKPSIVLHSLCNRFCYLPSNHLQIAAFSLILCYRAISYHFSVCFEYMVDLLMLIVMKTDFHAKKERSNLMEQNETKHFPLYSRHFFLCRYVFAMLNRNTKNLMQCNSISLIWSYFLHFVVLRANFFT